MKKVLLSLLLAIGSFATTNHLEAIKNFEEIYPYVTQTLEDVFVFDGDRHGQFEGDLVAFLSDGSAWKVLPTQREIFQKWNKGDKVRIKVRTDHYWIKREHKFSLYNQTTGEAVKVMIVQHVNNPLPLSIVSTDFYSKGLQAVTRHEWRLGKDNQWHYEPVIYFEQIMRKILCLSDGSFWVIKENFDSFTIGNHVYVGAQGHPKEWYDFVLITGTEREAIWTYGRPPK